VQHVDEPNVPEPSPLYWEQFSRRVHDAIQQEQPARQWNWASILAPSAGALVLCAGMLLLWTQTRSTVRLGRAVAVVEAPGVHLVSDDQRDLEDDVEWGLVRVAADDLEWDTAADAGIHANPGSAERVALEMSAAERQELERLIEAEMKQTGA
jgi:hypothetical protein